MASTLDFAVKQIRTELKTATSSSVRKAINDILRGRKVDASIITDVADKVINKAIGNILNTATQKVNSTIAKALGKTFKNSALSVIAGNYAADALGAIITGRSVPQITVNMTNAIADNLSKELFTRLPSSLTKNINIDILGTKMVTSLNPYIAKAIQDTMRAVIYNAFSSGNSGAANPSIPGLTQIPSIPTIDTIIPDLKKLPAQLTAIGDSITTISAQLGASAGVFIDSLSGIGDTDLKDIKLPAGMDLSRFTNGSDALGKMISMSSSDIGTLSKTPSISATEYREIQTQLANSNINNPLLSIGGSFDKIGELITGATTLSGNRSITKDLTCKLSDINDEFGVESEAYKKTLEGIKNNTVAISKNVAKQASTEAANFKSMSTDQLQKLTTIKEGFKDPNAKYPLPDYQERTETNKLATGDIENTVVDKKNSTRVLGAQLPNGEKWDQPVSPYNAQYPYNHVTETESGHVMEFDDTPGAERIHLYHKSGTFTEIDALGNKVSVIKGSDYTIIDANGYISINGRANVSVNGSCNVFVEANANIEVNGNTVLNCGNNIELNAAGRMKLTAGEGIDIKSPEIFVDADNQFQLNADISTKIHTKDFNMIVDTDTKIETHNDFRLAADNNIDVHSGGTSKHHSVGQFHIKSDVDAFYSAKNQHIKSTEKILQTSGTEFHIKSGSHLFNMATGNINNLATGNILEKCGTWAMTTGSGFFGAQNGNLSLNTSGNISMDGAKVNLNSNKSDKTGPKPPAATESTPATQAALAKANETEYCDANYITGRKAVQEHKISDSFVVQHNTKKISSDVIDTIMTGKSAVTSEVKAKFMEDYNVDPKAFDKTPIILEKAPQVVNTVGAIIPDEIPLGDIVVPANFKLSPFFTIESLTTHSVDGDELMPVGDAMSMSKVTANLQYIALNILEPIYAARPDMIIQSGFKKLTEEQKVYTRNNFGLSVTLDFGNATSFDDYYEIANIIKQIIPFDEIILIYMSDDFTNSHSNSALIVINSPGVFYPNVTDEAQVGVLNSWINAHEKKVTKTWFNGKLVDDSNIVRLA